MLHTPCGDIEQSLNAVIGRFRPGGGGAIVNEVGDDEEERDAE